MHPQYLPTLQRLLPWAQSDPEIIAVLLIGSQARAEHVSAKVSGPQAADQWSDLDLMIFVRDPQRLMQDNSWIHRFGPVTCTFDEIVPFQFDGWQWCVKRVLYADHRDVDFSILPFDHLDDVLEVNKDIIAKGCQVLYDSCGDLLEGKVRALVSQPQPTSAPSEAELRMVVSELLYHVIWATKKIRRGELWVAVNCINTHMKNLLLRLIEAHNAAFSPTPDGLNYSGRFLEQRTDPQILAKLAFCFTRYDPADAAAALQHLLELTRMLWQPLCEKHGWAFDSAEFEGIEKMYAEMGVSAG